MARRAEEEENHWPGFVDALSTIVMVVTFLLIILGIAIFVLSTQISKIVDQKDEDATMEVRGEFSSGAGEVEQIAQIQTQAANTEQAAVEEKHDVGQKEADKAEELTQDEEIVSNNSLTLQSRETENEREIKVAAIEKNDDKEKKKVAVQAAKEFLTVSFDEKAIELTDEASTAVQEFLSEHKSEIDAKKLTLFSFYDASSIAISQEKRSAYFRVLSVRNAIIASGVKGDQIEISVRPITEDDAKGRVKVFVK